MRRMSVSTGNTTGAVLRDSRVCAVLSGAAALLAGAGSIISLLVPSAVYGREQEALFQAGIAQDLANLFLVAPLLLVMSVRAFRGSLRAWLCCLGLLGFTVYNYVIYTFSIHLGPLFLVWVAVLGLSVFAFAGTLTALTGLDAGDRFSRVPTRLAGFFSIAVGVLFMLLWLSEIVPDIAAGRPSTSASVWDLPASPVHVLDLGLFIPAVIVSSVLLLRHRPLGYFTAPASLIFLAATCIPILITPFVAQARGEDPGWPVVPPIIAILLGSLIALYRLLRAVGAPAMSAPLDDGKVTEPSLRNNPSSHTRARDTASDQAQAGATPEKLPLEKIVRGNRQ